MRFANWYFLLLLLLIPLLHRWIKRRNKPARVIFPLALPKFVGMKSPLRILLALKYLGFAFVILALARPQSAYKQTERTVTGVEIMLVLDVSASMQIEDMADRSRLDIAKDTIEAFVKNRQNDRIGFIMFSGEPLTLAPPTLDYALVLKGVRSAEVNVLKDGTAIGDGLALAVSHLRESKAKSKVIILCTDGDNNVGQVDPLTAGELAAGYGIRVYTIAIGREGRVKMPIRQRGILGNTITTYQWFDNALNPELLQKISEMTHAKFFRVTDEATLESVYKEIDSMEKSEIKTTEKVKYEEIYEKPLKLGLLLLIVEQLLARLWWRVVP
jgi:Ca-activated chloride channel family protein